MRTPIVTIFIVCVLVLALGLAFYDYKKHGLHEQSIGITRSESDSLKNARLEGEEQSSKQNYDLAIDKYKRAIQISPTDAYVRNDLGVAYYYTGLKSMTPPVEEGEFDYGSEVDARRITGAESLKKTKEAMDKTESGIITVVVENLSANKEIEAYGLQQKNYLHIEEEKTYEGGTEYWITIIKGKTKEAFLNAEREYLKAIDLRSVRDATGHKYSNYSAASRNLGTLYFRMGRKKDAVAQWQRALQLEPRDAELRELVNKYESKRP